MDAEEERFHKLLYAIFDICELADFEIEGADCSGGQALRKGLEVMRFGPIQTCSEM